MKSVYQIAKENGVGAMTLYKRLSARSIKPQVVKGVMMLDEDQEQLILVYSKRGRKNAQDKKTSDQEPVR
jgi:hypothetical protein